MHIEPSMVDSAKIGLSYMTSMVSMGIAAKLAVRTLWESSAFALVTRCLVSAALVFCFFEVLPHHPVGVSEVHLIFGSTLFLMFGAGAAAVGLVVGLLVQGVFFAPSDLPQFGMNVTTLLAPLYVTALVARRIVPPNTPYKDLRYAQAFALSTIYQGGIASWVAFWAIYGQGFGAENLGNVLSFGAAYMSVILLEPLIDLAVLAAVKALPSLQRTSFLHPHLKNVGSRGRF